jgi:phosphoribosyl 1,2-cyclic phosphodiesterase
VRVHLCGVRGSTPAPGPAFCRVGGHTSCVAIAHDGSPAPSLILDAGTGIRTVTALLHGEPFDGAILLGHMHWDHTQGLPFFAGCDRDGARVEVHLPSLPDRDAEATVAGFMSPPHFPIDPGGLCGEWRFTDLHEGRLQVAGFEVEVREIPHLGGRTLGFRVSDGHSSLAYLSDHHPVALGAGPDGYGPYHDAARQLADGVDLLLHDAQYTADEFADRHHYGHSCVDYAVGLGVAAGVGEVALYHHDPARTDDEVDAIVAGFADAPVTVTAACEGTVRHLGAAPLDGEAITQPARSPRR